MLQPGASFVAEVHRTVPRNNIRHTHLYEGCPNSGISCPVIECTNFAMKQNGFILQEGTTKHIFHGQKWIQLDML